jgi:hypothetical protein
MNDVTLFCSCLRDENYWADGVCHPHMARIPAGHTTARIPPGQQGVQGPEGKGYSRNTAYRILQGAWFAVSPELHASALVLVKMLGSTALLAGNTYAPECPP